jgi:hypothetical protein
MRWHRLQGIQKHKPSALIDIRCKIQSAVMFADGKHPDCDCGERPVRHATSVDFKTFIYEFSGTFHNTFYERLLGGDGISIRGRRIRKQN